jgi:hypothetical protein
VNPKERDGVIFYLYHRTGKSRVVDTSKFSDEGMLTAHVEQLQREGWSRTRFAKTFYHRLHGTQRVYDQDQIKPLLKAGWQAEPFIPKDEQEASAIHKDAVHPHWNDIHRQASLNAEKA